MHSRNRILPLFLRNYRALKYGFTYKRNKHKSIYHDICFPNGYEKLFSEVLLDDEYFLDDINDNISTVIDIGGNLGIFSIASRLHFPESTITAFEPSDRVFPILERNAKVFNYKCVQKGIGSKNTTCKIIEGGLHGELTLIEESQNGEIEVISLDCIFQPARFQKINLLEGPYGTGTILVKNNKVF